MGTVIISIILLVIIGFVIYKIIKDRKQGKTCSCGCSACSMKDICHKEKIKDWH